MKVKLLFFNFFSTEVKTSKNKVIYFAATLEVQNLSMSIDRQNISHRLVF